jgi:anti-anti-sigma regulatory factor
MPACTLGRELTVTRGPDSLWVKLHGPEAPSSASPPLADRPLADETRPLADELWSLLECHFTYRLVLDLSEIDLVDRRLLGQLVALRRKILRHGGLMRLCGVSPSNQDILERQGLGDRFPSYCDLEEAVMGLRPNQPR